MGENATPVALDAAATDANEAAAVEGDIGNPISTETDKPKRRRKKTDDATPPANVRRDLVAEAISERDAEIVAAITHVVSWKRGDSVVVAGVADCGVVAIVNDSHPVDAANAKVLASQGSAATADKMSLTVKGMARIGKAGAGGGMHRIYRVWEV